MSPLLLLRAIEEVLVFECSLYLVANKRFALFFSKKSDFFLLHSAPLKFWVDVTKRNGRFFHSRVRSRLINKNGMSHEYYVAA